MCLTPTGQSETSILCGRGGAIIHVYLLPYYPTLYLVICLWCDFVFVKLTVDVDRQGLHHGAGLTRLDIKHHLCVCEVE